MEPSKWAKLAQLAAAVVGMAVTAPVWWMLWQLLVGGLLTSQTTLSARGLYAGLCVIAVGLLMGVVSLLLRFKQYRDLSRPPSLIPSVVVVALGVFLVGTAVVYDRSPAATASPPEAPTSPPASALSSGALAAPATP